MSTIPGLIVEPVGDSVHRYTFQPASEVTNERVEAIQREVGMCTACVFSPSGVRSCKSCFCTHCGAWPLESTTLYVCLQCNRKYHAECQDGETRCRRCGGCYSLLPDGTAGTKKLCCSMLRSLGSTPIQLVRAASWNPQMTTHRGAPGGAAPLLVAAVQQAQSLQGAIAEVLRQSSKQNQSGSCFDGFSNVTLLDPRDDRVPGSLVTTVPAEGGLRRDAKGGQVDTARGQQGASPPTSSSDSESSYSSTEESESQSSSVASSDIQPEKSVRVEITRPTMQTTKLQSSPSVGPQPTAARRSNLTAGTGKVGNSLRDTTTAANIIYAAASPCRDLPSAVGVQSSAANSPSVSAFAARREELKKINAAKMAAMGIDPRPTTTTPKRPRQETSTAERKTSTRRSGSEGNDEARGGRESSGRLHRVTPSVDPLAAALEAHHMQ